MKKEYFLDDYVSINAGDDVAIGIITNSKLTGLKFNVTGANGAVKVEVYEESNFTDGTELDGNSYDRINSEKPKTKFYSTPTIVNNGAELRTIYVGQNKSSGTIDRPHETKLKFNTKYLIKITNEENLINNVAFNFEWYEK